MIGCGCSPLWSFSTIVLVIIKQVSILSFILKRKSTIIAYVNFYLMLSSSRNANVLLFVFFRDCNAESVRTSRANVKSVRVY